MRIAKSQFPLWKPTQCSFLQIFFFSMLFLNICNILCTTITNHQTLCLQQGKTKTTKLSNLYSLFQLIKFHFSWSYCSTFNSKDFIFHHNHVWEKRLLFVSAFFNLSLGPRLHVIQNSRVLVCPSCGARCRLSIPAAAPLLLPSCPRSREPRRRKLSPDPSGHGHPWARGSLEFPCY